MIRSLIAQDADKTHQFKLKRNLLKTDLAAAYQHGEILWLDMTEPDDEEITWLENLINLHPEVVADIRRVDRRPTLLVYPDYLFLSLFEPKVHLHKIEGTEIHCLIGDNFFITIRQNQDTEVEAAYKRVSQQHPQAWRRGTPYLLYLTIQYVVDSYYPLLDKLSLQLNKLEEHIMLGELNEYTRQKNYHIKQQLIALRQMVAPQREVLSSVIGEERLASNSEHRDLYRHLYERLLRVYDVIDSQRELSGNILDLLQGYESAKLANAVSRLTIISMIFLPLTFIAGLLELNFIMPERAATIPVSGGVAFVLLLMMMSIVGGMMTFFFRRKGWI